MLRCHMVQHVDAAGELEVGAAHGVAVQLGAGQPNHVSHPDCPLHGACLALALRLPGPGQCRQRHQGGTAGEPSRQSGEPISCPARLSTSACMVWCRLQTCHAVL